MLTDENPTLIFADVVALIDDMMITGHFIADSLVKRNKWYPNEFGVWTSNEIVSLIYKTAKIEENDEISLKQFEYSLMTLAKGRRWYEKMISIFLSTKYKPWIQTWYCNINEYGTIKEDFKNNTENKEKHEHSQSSENASSQDKKHQTQ